MELSGRKGLAVAIVESSIIVALLIISMKLLWHVDFNILKVAMNTVVMFVLIFVTNRVIFFGRPRSVERIVGWTSGFPIYYILNDDWTYHFITNLVILLISIMALQLFLMIVNKNLFKESD